MLCQARSRRPRQRTAAGRTRCIAIASPRPKSTFFACLVQSYGAAGSPRTARDGCWDGGAGPCESRPTQTRLLSDSAPKHTAKRMCMHACTESTTLREIRDPRGTCPPRPPGTLAAQQYERPEHSRSRRVASGQASTRRGPAECCAQFRPAEREAISNSGGARFARAVALCACHSSTSVLRHRSWSRRACYSTSGGWDGTIR